MKRAAQNAEQITEKLNVIVGFLITGVLFMGVIAFVMVTDLMIKISVE